MYPEHIEEVKKLPEGQRMITAWGDFVSWMASRNPQPKYQLVKITS